MYIIPRTFLSYFIVLLRCVRSWRNRPRPARKPLRSTAKRPLAVTHRPLQHLVAISRRHLRVATGHRHLRVAMGHQPLQDRVATDRRHLPVATGHQPHQDRIAMDRRLLTGLNSILVFRIILNFPFPYLQDPKYSLK